jgi:hypothetical protein
MALFLVIFGLCCFFMFFFNVFLMIFGHVFCVFFMFFFGAYVFQMIFCKNIQIIYILYKFYENFMKKYEKFMKICMKNFMKI